MLDICILIVKFKLPSRAAIINEMTTTMAIYGISVDKRHIMLIADLMTYRVREISYYQPYNLIILDIDW